MADPVKDLNGASDNASAVRRKRLSKQKGISIDTLSEELTTNIHSLCDSVVNYTNKCQQKTSGQAIVAPMIVVMSEFKQKKINNEQWYSPVFCTHEQGYQFRLRVDANGWCSGDAVAVVVSLVKGDHDDELEWPFQGTITVQILNHIKNSSHSTVKEFIFKDSGYECQRVIDEAEPEFGCWCDRFITHSELQYNPIKKSQYLKDDSLLFLINCKSMHTL